MRSKMWWRVGFKIANCYKYIILVFIAIFILLLGLSFNPHNNDQINDLPLNIQHKLDNTTKLYNKASSSFTASLLHTTNIKQMELRHTKHNLENCSRGSKLGECSVFSSLLQLLYKKQVIRLRLVF